jgi:PIN domain nuclease of toxin-antitoxin system
MRLLLDTHIWLWTELDPDHITRRVAREMENPDTELWLSPISIWETLMLADKGRVRLEPNPLTWINRALRALPLREAQITYEVAQETGRVQISHRDPADRFLLATAKVFSLTLVTADEKLLDVPAVQTLPNR